MTVTTATVEPVAVTETPRERGRVRWYISDVVAVLRRNLILMRRDPVSLVFMTLQPIFFVLIFAFVFGEVMELQVGVIYIDYLMPGIFAQTVAFGAMGTGVGLADDLQSGMIERFRSLPMAPSSVLIGRSLADLTRNVWVVGLMFAMGTVLGFRVHGPFGLFLAGVFALVLFGYSLSWLFAFLGMSGKPERVVAISFPILFPLVFASTAFVPTELLPEWLAWFAERQPTTFAIEAMRYPVFNLPNGTLVAQSVAWSLGIIAVMAPLTVWRFRRAR